MEHSVLTAFTATASLGALALVGKYLDQIELALTTIAAAL